MDDTCSLANNKVRTGGHGHFFRSGLSLISCRQGLPSLTKLKNVVNDGEEGEVEAKKITVFEIQLAPLFHSDTSSGINRARRAED